MPPFLYVKGIYQPRDERCVALIGSLTPSETGVKRARRLARLLVENGYTIVSGLARGIDTASHTATLEAGGRTLAVVGTGLDIIYPPENAWLAETIERCGAVFSQFPLGAGPTKYSFPKRNGVMSALSWASIIVEGHADCGSVIQARLALRQGRQVYLLRSNFDQADNTWAQELKIEGAQVAGEIGDILSTLRSPLTAPQMRQGALAVPEATTQEETTRSPLRSAAKHNTPRCAAAVLFDLEGTLFDAGDVMALA